MHESAGNPSLVIAIALAAGIIAQSLAQHLRIPGIVLLLAAGILLGPDGLGVVQPSDLGNGLHLLVGFAIAVILFEGGLNLVWRRLRGEAATIRRLVTLGALITWLGGALAAHWLLGWPWAQSALFGSLIIVTGPTVVTPILRRIKLRHELETVLEAEGVFIDAVGAMLAVVALEVVVGYSHQALAHGVLQAPIRLLGGALLGLAGGFVIVLTLRRHNLIPDGLENVFTLSMALAIFQGSNAILPESGIAAVIVAGMVVGNSRINVHRELREFKEQLTVMLIGMLFVLLAADVSVREVLSIGIPGVLVVLSLMLIVRPVGVLACTIRSEFTWREKAFLSWLAPRGIVAAAVATLFYERMQAEGMSGAAEMRGLVFLVIAMTVVIEGGSAGVVAARLGLRRVRNDGYVILGAHQLSIALAKLLRDGGEEVVLIDANPEACHDAERAGFRALNANALEDPVLVSADLETRRAVIGFLRNDGVNLLFARKAIEEFKVPITYVAVQRGHDTLTVDMARESGSRVLLGGDVDLDLWDIRVGRGQAEVALWRRRDAEAEFDAAEGTAVPRELQNVLVPLAVKTARGAIAPFYVGGDIAGEDSVYWILLAERGAAAREWLGASGWVDTTTIAEIPQENRL